MAVKKIHIRSIYTHINAYALNKLHSAKVTHTIDLGLLSPRMKTMLINQYKRGYGIGGMRGYGMQSRITEVLNKYVDLKGNLPLITKFQYSPGLENTAFIKWFDFISLMFPTCIRTKTPYIHYLRFNPDDEHNAKAFYKIVTEYMISKEYLDVNKAKHLEIVHLLEEGASLIIEDSYTYSRRKNEF